MVLAQFGTGRRAVPLIAGFVLALFFFFMWTSPPALNGYLGQTGYGTEAAPPQQEQKEAQSEGQNQPPPPPSGQSSAPLVVVPPGLATPLQSPEATPSPAKEQKQKVQGLSSTTAYVAPASSQTAPLVALSTAKPASGSGGDVQKPLKFLVILGDSYSWTAFDVEKEWPSKQNPIGNPKYPGMTLSHGANWVGWLTAKYNSTFLYTFNLAFAGATTDNSLVDAGKFRDFKEQVTHDYIPYIVEHPERMSWTPEETVVGICLGINDIARTWGAPIEEFHVLAGKLMDSYWKSVERVYDTGIRKFFLLNVPPLQYTPSVLNDKNKARFPQWELYSEYYNEQLDKRMGEFKQAHPNVMITNFDQNAVYRRVLAEPKKYGLQFNDTIGDAQTHIWTDPFHSGTLMHEVVARELAIHVRAFGLAI